LELDDDPTVHANRGIAHQHLGRYAEAISDFNAALAATAEDHDDLLRRRRDCHEGLA
jgi:tetratricopeptide (TPR) repeat protein